MSEEFRRRLAYVLRVGVEHSLKHSRDLENLAFEARKLNRADLADSLLEAASKARELAAKLKQALNQIED